MTTAQVIDCSSLQAPLYPSQYRYTAQYYSVPQYTSLHPQYSPNYFPSQPLIRPSYREAAVGTSDEDAGQKTKDEHMEDVFEVMRNARLSAYSVLHEENTRHATRYRTKRTGKSDDDASLPFSDGRINLANKPILPGLPPVRQVECSQHPSNLARSTSLSSWDSDSSYPQAGETGHESTL
jgi:hypothetical protein